jgi:hypothetical protein
LASAQTSGEVTYAKDIAPILQRSCQNCHRADGAAPMPLTTYEEVRPWARSIKLKTGLGPRAGVMPPWYKCAGGTEGHCGLRGMSERASVVGGRLSMWSEADDGTEVELRVPARAVYLGSQQPLPSAI